MSASANTVWASAFVDELARNGIREIVLAPGSRSTPLVMACAADDRLRMRVHLDERSAAFFALGVGKATGAPAAVVTTSGTAAANVLPAVVEASMAAVPLLVLTADRPHRLRGADANQAIDQVGLYGGFVRAFHEVAPASASDSALRHLRALACRSVAEATGPTAGPVHLNFPFDKPLEPSASETVAVANGLGATGRSSGAPFVAIQRGHRSCGVDELQRLAEALRTPRGVIVAGPSSRPGETGPAALALAQKTGFPLLADPLSGARYGPSGCGHRVGGYDLLLTDPDVAEHLRPSLIVRFGTSPTSAPLQEWLTRHDGTPHIVIDGESRWKDHQSVATMYVAADPARTVDALDVDGGPAVEDAWSEVWRAAEGGAVGASIGSAIGDHEGTVLRSVTREAPDGSTLVVSSSMPVRDLDAYGAPREAALTVFGNRGASGIDGVVSTAFGISSQRPGAVICVIGDVAFFHDQNGLLWSREDDASVVFVLIDNDGGGIFHMLPIADHDPHFTEYFATPHGLDLAHAASLHGLDVVDASGDDVGAVVVDAVAAGRTVVVRVRSERTSNIIAHRASKAAARAGARAALGLGVDD